jgi:hypothetical protein
MEQIATILKEELMNQAVLDSSFTEPQVYLERFVEIDHSYLPAVNVTFDRGDYQNQSVKHQLGIYTFFIEAYTKGKTSEQSEGSELASKHLRNLLGRCHHILMHPLYDHLNFQRPKISRKYIKDITVGNPTEHNSEYVSMGKLEFNVEIPELGQLATPAILQENITTVQLYDTDEGYKWIYQAA